MDAVKEKIMERRTMEWVEGHTYSEWSGEACVCHLNPDIRMSKGWGRALGEGHW